ncbi:metal ABC transporter ATP-binding protein [Candidatus Aerophobetes bacterium]|nr:metal ABC transporter ATP-binding protein [Candidatus Aerophobetes bacterium]
MNFSSTQPIKLKNVSTIYEGEKIPAIKDVNLIISRGEMVTIIGPNGAGKTTLLETINGLLPHTAGKVEVLGKDIKKYGSYIRRRTGYVPQEITFAEATPFLVEDVILMGRFGKIGLFKSPTRSDYEKVREVMRLIGIQDLAKKPIGKLSGGQVQKVMIARALAKEPELLLLDEPFSNLDLNALSDISRKISYLHTIFNLTTLMVIHNVASIPPSCNRAILINQGRIVEDNLSGKRLNFSHLKMLYRVNL